MYHIAATIKPARLNYTLQEMSQSIHLILSYLLRDYFLYFVNLFENAFECIF